MILMKNRRIKAESLLWSFRYNLMDLLHQIMPNEPSAYPLKSLQKYNKTASCTQPCLMVVPPLKKIKSPSGHLRRASIFKRILVIHRHFKLLL